MTRHLGLKQKQKTKEKQKQNSSTSIRIMFYPNLNAHEQIWAVLFVETIVVKIFTSLVDLLDDFMIGWAIRIELPELPPNMTVHRAKPRAPSFRDLKLPHLSPTNDDHLLDLNSNHDLISQNN